MFERGSGDVLGKVHAEAQRGKAATKNNRRRDEPYFKPRIKHGLNTDRQAYCREPQNVHAEENRNWWPQKNAKERKDKRGVFDRIDTIYRILKTEQAGLEEFHVETLLLR